MRRAKAVLKNAPAYTSHSLKRIRRDKTVFCWSFTPLLRLTGLISSQFYYVCTSWPQIDQSKSSQIFKTVGNLEKLRGRHVARWCAWRREKRRLSMLHRRVNRWTTILGSFGRYISSGTCLRMTPSSVQHSHFSYSPPRPLLHLS